MKESKVRLLPNSYKKVLEFLTGLHSIRKNGNREIVNWMQCFSRPENFSCFIDELCNEQTLILESLCENSYSHPLSFTKVMLAKDHSTGSQLRLHIWEKEAGIMGTDIEPHSHTRDYWSLVLLGELEVVKYCEVVSGQTYQKYSASDAQDSDGYVYTHLGQVNLSEQSRTQVLQGGVHNLNYDFVHSVNVSNLGPVITLFLQGPTKSNHSFVYRPKDLGRETNSTQKLSRSEYCKLLYRAADFLPKKH